MHSFASQPPPGTEWWQVAIDSAPILARLLRPAKLAVARAMRLPLSDAEQLLGAAPVILPRYLREDQAQNLVVELKAAGAQAGATRVSALSFKRCGVHEKHNAAGDCMTCGGNLCSLCLASSRTGWHCVHCVRRTKQKRTFFTVRVSALLLVLFSVLLWGWRDFEQRQARTNWTRPLNVAFVILQQGPVASSSIAALKERLHALEAQFQSEFLRHRGQKMAPFLFLTFGPIPINELPPRAEADTLTGLVKFNYELWRYLSQIDERTGVDQESFDSRIYVVVREPKSVALNFVEGHSQIGGRIGVVSVELGPTMTDFALFVAAHELLHTLGANDKYDASGRALLPLGLAEPDLVPLYPQRFIEVMARNRPLSPGREVPPDSLTELRVGAETAREIGWRH